MWLAKKKTESRTECAGEVGSATIGGAQPSVYLDGERRRAAVYGPGGYRWRPAEGDDLLVLKAGAEREQPCVIGCAGTAEDVEAGEVKLFSGGCSVDLDGETQTLTGTIMVNGQSLEDYIKKIIRDSGT